MKIFQNNEFDTFHATFEAPKKIIRGQVFDHFQIRTTDVNFFYLLRWERMVDDEDVLFREIHSFIEKPHQKVFII